MKCRKGMNIKEYYEASREWLQKIAQSSDMVVGSMAPAIISVASESEQNLSII